MISAASATPVWSFHSHAIAAGLLANFFWNASGWPLASTGNGVLPVVSTPMPMTWSGLKPFTDFFAVASACLMVISAPVDVIRRMLPGEIRVARQDHALRAVRVVQTAVADFRAVGDVDDEGANRVRAVVQIRWCIVVT